MFGLFSKKGKENINTELKQIVVEKDNRENDVVLNINYTYTKR
jgi:hypothetical protein